jgi:hypothetical protein
MTRKLMTAVVSIVALAAAVAAGAFAGKAPSKPAVLADAKLKPHFTTTGGAEVVTTTRTVQHWFGTTTNPDDGVTYGYDMVGADPNTCSGSACDVTIEADITPIVVTIDGYTFDGTQVVAPTLASPLFTTNDYGRTRAASNSSGAKGPGGTLSQGDAGKSLQLEDATMRAQFDKTGSSPYHLRLHANVLPAVTVDVPANHAAVFQSGRGVLVGELDTGWWASQINNLESKADPTHLAVYLTNDVLLYRENDPLNCCVIGFHGTQAAGLGGGRGKANGNAAVQTFAWASYTLPGLFDPSGAWAIQDINPLSHEIAEWADDPFATNTVEPWQTPTAPAYGCQDLLETGDPVVGVGFAIGQNTYAQDPSPDGSRSADGSYHPEEEVFLPWFMRTAPNTISEPTQRPSTNIGRYSFMGDLDPFPSFHQPATGC